MNRRSALMRSLNANCLIRFLMSLKRKRSSGLHHLAGVETADKIVFLENGKAEMEGSHQELLAENERYRKLYRLDVPIRT